MFQFPTWTDIEVFLRTGVSDEEPPFQNVLYAGVLIPLKGMHHLIHAFARIAKDFPQARLVLVGREENKSYAAELKAQVGRLALTEKVQFVGEVSQAELSVRMRRACVLVLPSYSEGLPRVIFEAMAIGLLVIASAISSIPEIVQDGVTGLLVSPGDEAVLAERLRWALEHPGEAREIGGRARAFAERCFSTGAYVQGYRQIFEAAAQVLLKGRGLYRAPAAF